MSLCHSQPLFNPPEAKRRCGLGFLFPPRTEQRQEKPAYESERKQANDQDTFQSYTPANLPEISVGVYVDGWVEGWRDGATRDTADTVNQ